VESNVFSIEYILENGLNESAYGFIYITINEINNMKYIGQKMFRKDWKYYMGSGIRLINVFKKYGKGNFSREIIAIAYSKEELNELEIEFIQNYNAVESKDYYNIVGGGGVQTGFHHSKETKNKLSKLKIGEHHPLFGKHHSEETRQKMRKPKNKYIRSESNAKFTDQQANEIREKYTTGKYFQYELAEEYSVTQTTICNIINFKGVYKSSSKKPKSKRKMCKLYTKFTDKQAIEIREKFYTGKYKQRELAKEYDCSNSVISNVINYKGVYKMT